MAERSEEEGKERGPKGPELMGHDGPFWPG